MRKYFLTYSIWATVICIVITLVVNIKIAQEYFGATGKRRAFFELHAAIEYVWRYYLVIPPVITMIAAFFSKKQLAQPGKRATVVLLGLVSAILIFVKLWRVFVWIVE